MSIRYLICMLTLALPVTAFADVHKDTEAIDITPESVYFKLNVFNLADKSGSFLKIVGILGTDFIIVPDRVSGQIELHVGPTRATFNETIGENLSLQSTWASDAIVSILAGPRLTIFRRSSVEVVAYLKFESSLFSQGMEPERFVFTSEGTEYDVSEYAKKHTSVSFGWSRWIMGFDVRAQFGMFTPYLALGFEKHAFTVDLKIDKDGKELIRSLGENPSSVTETYEVDYYIPTVGLGTYLKLPDLPLVITADVVLIPVNLEKLFLSATLGISLKL